jgi:drug/metabolite transporter (DMT)-like permease
VLAFSFSLPANKLAVAGLDPLSVTALRAAGAGLLAGAYLLIGRAGVPERSQLRDLALSSLGVVIGFPLFCSFALMTNNTGQSAVILGLLPAVTAAFAALLGAEHLPRTFWAPCLGGVLVLVGYLSISSYQSTGAFTLRLGDLWMLAATVSAGYGYAMGGRAARTVGGSRSISWALVLLLPVSVPGAALALLAGTPRWTPAVGLGLGYVLVVSQFLGFIAWYGGLARGGIARVGQVQQVQPLLTLAWAALLLGEPFSPWTIVVGVTITALVAIAQGARFRQAPPARPGSEPGPGSRSRRPAGESSPAPARSRHRQR